MLLSSVKNSFGRVNIITILLLVLAFAFYAKLSQKHMEIMLQIIICLLPDAIAIQLPKTIFKINRIMSIYKRPIVNTRIFCTECLQFYSGQNIKESVHKLHSKAYLILYDLKDLYSMKLYNSTFCKNLVKGIMKKSGNYLEGRFHNITYFLIDIQDGRIIRTMKKKLNLLYPKTNQSVSIFIDGISIFKSSDIGLYPGKFDSQY